MCGHKPKDEAEFCEVSPVMAVLVKQLLLPLLEQLDRLLALLLQVLDEYLEVLVRVQQVQLVLQVMSLKSFFPHEKGQFMFCRELSNAEAFALFCHSR